MIREATHKLLLACLFLLAAASAGAQTGTRIYVSLEGSEANTGLESWDNATTLSKALESAVAGTEIWMKGYTELDKVYSVGNGLTLPAGVQLYGGFAGTETSIDQRELVDGGIAYRMKYRTVLSGDGDTPDMVDSTNLIFPENSLRRDNATHVLTLDLSAGDGALNSGTTTVVNGVTIARGHNATGEGGGIFVTNNGRTQQVGYRIEQCFFVENYGTKGGGLYVENGVKEVNGAECIVDRCGFFNNAAGNRSDLSNSGGALYVGGAGLVVNTAVFNNENGGILLGSSARVLNCTVVRNTGSGIDGAGATVQNTVIWGNAALSAGEQPTFTYCAYPEVDATNPGTNVPLAEQNNAAGGPLFNSPSLQAGYDRDYNMTITLYPLWTWVPQEGSALIDAGETEAYDATSNLDLAGNARLAGPDETKTIDIGAFEFQPVLATRIRYVKPNGTGTGDGSSWGNASGDLQRMIDELADNNPQNLPGEVWVAAGTYEPQAYLISNAQYSASFRMRDGISVYGGFVGTEASKADRDLGKDGMPWQSEHRTILQGSYYSDDNVSYTNNRWSLTGDSRHVVWFAPMPGEAPFARVTRLDGVTVKGGYAQGGTGQSDFMTDRGAGVYMDGRNAYLTNCIVTQNYATGAGGGVYLKDGRIQGSLLYNNNAGTNGGAVYVDSTGLVLRSMLANNSAGNGAGAYLAHKAPVGEGVEDHPEYLILSTCVVTNNTARQNGAIYCAGGGVLMQNTVANNYCPTTTDATDPNASQTGGLYIDGYGLVINSVLWNNRLGSTTGANIPIYVRNPSVDNVRFLHNALSGVNNVVWNDVYTLQTLSLSDDNLEGEGMVGPNFEGTVPGEVGVNPNWKDDTNIGINYYWQPEKGSNLWARGMELGQLPKQVVLAPEVDLGGTLFAQRPAIGAHSVEGTQIVPELDGTTLRLYVDVASTLPENDGRSWAMPYRSLNDAIRFFAGLTDNSEITVWNGSGIQSFIYTSASVRSFEILVLEGNLYPRYAYVNDDPKTATLDILPMPDGQTLRIAGGYAYRNTTPQDAYRDPLNHRSQLNGNNDGDELRDGIYHVVTVEPEANVTLDGFHIINGYAAGTAALQYGAGMLVHSGAEVTVENCIFENNTAVSGAAVYAPEATSLTLTNCVVNNNTNTTASNSVIAGPDKLELNHVTIVNNVGAAPTGLENTSSFAAGNTSGVNNVNLATTGSFGAANFANPTNNVGATLGFDTYLGGYSSFRPLTSSDSAANAIINKVATATDLTNDIMGNDRDLGGVPDLGAYEADLPKKGRVYYVRTPDDGGDDSHDGLSWTTAFATVRKAVETAYDGEVIEGEKPQVWVAAGTYRQNPQNGSDNCFEILDGVNVYGAFPKKGTPGMGERHPFISQYVYHEETYFADDYETILQPQSGNSGDNVRRVLGQADEYNPFAPITTRVYKYVGKGKGNYEYNSSGYIQNEGGDYYLSENEGEYIKALPALCDWLYWGENSGYYKYFSTPEYENIRSATSRQYKDFIYVGENLGDYSLTTTMWGGRVYNEESGGGYVEFINSGYYSVGEDVSGALYFEKGTYTEVIQGQGTHIRTEQGFNYVGSGYGNYVYQESGYTFVGTGNGSYELTENNEFSFPTRWDGFTLRNGYINSNNIAYLNESGKRNGGAGAVFFNNVTLANSIIYNCVNTSSDSGQELRGGGVYTDGGTIVNCYFLENRLGQSAQGQTQGQYTAYGGGVYLYNGTVYNSVISKNITLGRHTDGAGVFIENGRFFNNTIVANKSEGTIRGNGGICIYKDEKSIVPSRLVIYNCIVLDNSGFVGDMIGNYDIAVSNSGVIECHNTLSSSITNVGTSVGTQPRAIEYYNSKVYASTDLFEDYVGANYRLNGTAGLNMGENMPIIDGDTIDLFDYTDMDFTDRIKDCTIDAGAYELENIENTKPDKNNIYYVTQNGAGTSSGDSPINAACAMKLQTVLDAAGELAKTGVTPIVKIAGYTDDNPFVYHANTLFNPNDPRSYTYRIPAGVTVMGGYNEGTYEDGKPVEGTSNWDEDNRNVTEYKTCLSAIKEATSTTQEVNGYHAVTFGEQGKDGTDDLSALAIIDGVWLQDGAATSLAGTGNANTRGGGAIVPNGAHVRNCVVTGNAAVEGGGLYVLPGGRVSGTLVMENTATTGGGIYVDNEGVNNAESATDNNRAHFFSNTIVENKADEGGGLYLEDGAAMTVNSVIWGNTAGMGKDVSGVSNSTFADNLLTDIAKDISGWYPFNNCFVQETEFPGNFENTSMTGEAGTYFANTDLYQLKAYSPLVNHGMVESVQTVLEDAALFGLAANDMAGTSRTENKQKIDVGAFAKDGAMPTELVTRLFVSQGSKVELGEIEDEADYIGRSFYTSFTWLEDALDYIEHMRSQTGNVGEEARAANFDILVAQGTYKPHYRRKTNGTQADNSFVIPYGVRIYGGFTGTESYKSDNTNWETIPGVEDVSEFRYDEAISKVLSARAYSDFNQNYIAEAWELAAQTIFSGALNGTTNVPQNAHHVFYTEAEDATNEEKQRGVVLDGVTVMGGATETTLSNITANAADLAEGRGGGIYSNGVPYTIVRSRLLDNQAVRGGAVFVKDADLKIVNSIVAGNRTVANTNKETSTLTSRGGAVYVAGNKTATTLYAVNTLWANNESAGEGGAIGTNYAEGVSGNADPLINLMNNTFVRNKATTNAVLYNHNGKSTITNTLIWGNESEKYNDATDVANMPISHSASDYNYGGAFEKGNNVLLSTDNMSTDGPRFTRPSTVAGAAGNDATNLWNPASTSLVTDAGNTELPVGFSFPDGARLATNEEDEVYGLGTSYYDWFESSSYAADYFRGVNNSDYARYSGPRGENNEELDKKIDIGVYEYQYSLDFSKMPAIYVATVRAGDGSGTNWDNATDDLRGAIIGAANPTSSEIGGEGIDGTHRTVYVRDGEYMWPQLSTGTAYPLNATAVNDFQWERVTIKGSCNGVGLGDAAQQDYSKPSVIRNDPDANGITERLMNISANDKKVTVDGFTFINGTGNGIEAGTREKGSLTLSHTAFRQNSSTGVTLTSNAGEVLIVNTLFADGGTGLASSGTATLVNTTFANNGTDMTIAGSETNVYNSVSWSNTTQNMPAGNNNANIAAGTENRDLHEGPNFVDPDNGNYRIRPSLTLLNKGSNVNYQKQALGYEDAEEETPFPEDERDLYNVPRKVDTSIDIGAYEYEAPLQPIVYVKADLHVDKPDGRSWETALGDLQGAVDLAGIYANEHLDIGGYVFVHSNVSDDDLRVTLENTKVYGSMNDETSSFVVYGESSINTDNVKSAIEELLEKRIGLLEGTNRSTLGGVSVLEASVVDGFEVNGPVTLSEGGYLSTSIVNNESAEAAVTGTGGILYNTLVYGSVEGVQSVNVTAMGEINGASNSANNREGVTEENRYVKDAHWKYQLNEDDEVNIDGAALQDLSTYTEMVGHSRDIAGNQRIRNVVDNGCFETWNVDDQDATVSSTDYPHGKSVVYVRRERELILGDGASAGTPLYGTAEPFNPGFLLLEHQAGLRGNGNYIGLTNFAVERDLGSDGKDLAAVPFTIVDNELPHNIVDATNVTVQTYDGDVRADYYYAFDGADGKAWVTVDRSALVEQQGGFALENTSESDQKVRFYGTTYTETPGSVDVSLPQHNYSDPWSSPADGGNRFTHKENMGWNLFGSPYLCAMNYSDMEYGRVLYGLTGEEGNASYTSVLTYNNETGAPFDGHIPAGDAVFTQTATLQKAEEFSVEQPVVVESGSNKSGTAYEKKTNLLLYLASASDGAAKRSVATPAEADRLQLNVVPDEQSIADFDLGIDGVKWMAGGDVPQIFAVRGAGRYSLLGALSEETTTTVGVTTPEAGLYTIGIPDDCPAEEYETVVLTDRATGAVSNLLQGPYTFRAAAGEDATERFEVRFKAAAEELQAGPAMEVRIDGKGLLTVLHLPEGTTRVALLDAAGRTLGETPCEGIDEVRFTLPAHGVYIVVPDRGESLKVVW